jgi:hypothetical protein
MNGQLISTAAVASALVIALSGIPLAADPLPCPPGDDRGRVYKTTNLRTRETWTLPDSQYSCGGA